MHPGCYTYTIQPVHCLLVRYSKRFQMVLSKGQNKASHTQNYTLYMRKLERIYSMEHTHEIRIVHN